MHIWKWLARLALWGWCGYWVTQIFMGDLGAAPALTLNHKLGHIALVALTANLALGIAADFWRPLPQWLRPWLGERRFWGVSSFLILLAHVFLYFVNEGFESQAWVQIYTKSYLIFAILAFFLLALLAATSNNLSMRKLGGRRWKQLHRLVYVAQILLFGHILAIEKANLLLYGPWLVLLAIAQALRWYVHFRRKPKAPSAQFSRRL